MNNYPVGQHRPQNGGGQRNGRNQRPEREEEIIDAEFSEARSGFKTAREDILLKYLVLWALLLGELVIITVMWLLNIAGARALNIPIGIVSTLVILFFGFLPRNVGWAGAAGGIIAFLMDRDKTQGIATGPVWLYRIVVGVSFAFLLCALLLMFWNFQPSPGAFWIVFVGSILLAMLASIQKGNNGPKQVVSGLIVIFMAIAMGSTIFNKPVNFFGGASTTLPTIESCTGAFGNALDCNQVTLTKDGESYKRMLPTAACTHWYPEENVEYRVSGSVLRLYTTAEEVTVSVYSVPIGESFNGEACNG